MILSTIDIKLIITDNRFKTRRKVAHSFDSKDLEKLPAKIIVENFLEEIKPYLLKEIEWMKPIED